MGSRIARQPRVRVPGGDQTFGGFSADYDRSEPDGLLGSRAVLALFLVFALARAPFPAAPPSPDWSAWPALGTITTPFGPTHSGIDIGILRSLAVRALNLGP